VSISTFARVLAWPVVSLLLTGGLHFVLEAVWPDLRATFVPAVLAALLLACGLWVGYAMVEAGGTYLHALAGGVVLAILPVLLDEIGFGIILGRGTTAGALAAAFGGSTIVWGALLGGGVALSRRAGPATNRAAD